MAGIGFELRKILKEGRLSSMLRAYGYSALIGAGPWLISIASIMVAGYIAHFFVEDKKAIVQFQVVVTYTLAFSLILTGFSNFAFTRYISDRLFEKEHDRVLPNTIGILLINMSLGFWGTFVFAIFFLKELGIVSAIMFVSTFTVLCGIWIINVLLTGLKNYKFILLSFLLSYGLALVLIPFLGRFNLGGLLTSFFLGQMLLFMLLGGYLVYKFPSDRFAEFDFLNRKRSYPSLVFTGFFYYIGIWIDKIVFWFTPDVSDRVIGPFRASVIYDLPIFLAYLSIMPGMAVFLIRLETDFAESYDHYYRNVREEGTLERLILHGKHMVDNARASLLDILRIQGIANIFIFLITDEVFSFFKLSFLYIPLFHIDLIGAYLQLFFMSILAILFYFDKRKESLILTMLFAVFNGILSYFTIHIGPSFFGYGFVISVLMVSIAGLILLRDFMRRLHYETFMRV